MSRGADVDAARDKLIGAQQHFDKVLGTDEEGFAPAEVEQARAEYDGAVAAAQRPEDR